MKCLPLCLAHRKCSVSVGFFFLPSREEDRSATEGGGGQSLRVAGSWLSLPLQVQKLTFGKVEH